MLISIVIFAYAVYFLAAGIFLDRIVFLPLEAQIRELMAAHRRFLTDRGDEASPSVPPAAPLDPVYSESHHPTDQNTSVKENS